MSKKVILLFFLISFTLVCIFFRGRSLLGGGESGAAFYDLSRMLTISGSTWVDNLLGLYIGQVVANIPFFTVLSFLQMHGIPGYVLQAGFFFVMLFVSLVSMYFFSKELFPEYGNNTWILSSLFYLFNLYSLVNIWGRFLLNMMLFYSILPLLLWIFVLGIKRKKYSYSIIIGVLSAIFSYAFSTPTHVIIFWGLIFLFSIFYLFFGLKDRKLRFFLIKYLFLNLILWILFNFWWLSQEIYFSFSGFFKASVNLFFTSSGNQEALNSLSIILGRIANLVLLKHGSYFIGDSDFPYRWPNFFSNPFAVLMEWLFTLSVLLMAVKRLKKSWVLFFIVLFTFGIFISKGNSPPLGGIFNFVFNKFSFLQFFRNPFEKLGILMSFAMSVLVGVGCVEFSNHFPKFKKFIIVVSFIYILVFLGFPFWTGLVFTNDKAPANDPKIGIQVQVPDYYRPASSWLSKNIGLERFISFPLGGEGIFYNWPKGYIGVEQAAVLFSNPSISNKVDFPYYSQIVGSLEKLFLTQRDFYKVASILNVKYLLLRPDFDFQRSTMRDPVLMSKELDKKASDADSKLSFVQSFGPLKFYKFADDVLVPFIYAAKRVVVTDNKSSLEDLFAYDSQKYDVLYPETQGSNYLEGKNLIGIVHNQAVFDIAGPTFPLFSLTPDAFPHVSKLSTSSLYPLILFRERVDLMLQPGREQRVNQQILLLGKRLMEAKEAGEVGDVVAFNKSLLLYNAGLPEVIATIKDLTRTAKAKDEQIWHEKSLLRIFSSHLYLLDSFKTGRFGKEDVVDKTLTNFHLQTANVEILPYYDLLNSEGFPISERVVYQFDVSRSSDYDITILKTGTFPSDFDLGGGVKVQIDDKVEERKISFSGDQVSFGKIHFDKGIHEISFNRFSAMNNVQVDKDFVVEAKSEKSSIEIPLTKFDPYTQYDISFDYWIKYGDGFTFSVGLDNDLPAKNENDFHYYYTHSMFPDNYFYDFKHFSTIFTSDPSAGKAKLIFSAKPWNDCLEVYFKTPNKCKDETLKSSFNRPTFNTVKNLFITPRLPRSMILLDGRGDGMEVPSISFYKISSTKYNVKVRGSSGGFLLAFLNLYDTGWKAYINESNYLASLPETNHVLINDYANGWWVDKKGDFDMTLEFFPEKLLRVGWAVSIVSMGIATLVFSLLFLRKRAR